jgi:hypothetical protein
MRGVKTVCKRDCLVGGNHKSKQSTLEAGLLASKLPAAAFSLLDFSLLAFSLLDFLLLVTVNDHSHLLLIVPIFVIILLAILSKFHSSFAQWHL